MRSVHMARQMPTPANSFGIEMMSLENGWRYSDYCKDDCHEYMYYFPSGLSLKEARHGAKGLRDQGSRWRSSALAEQVLAGYGTGMKDGSSHAPACAPRMKGVWSLKLPWLRTVPCISRG